MKSRLVSKTRSKRTLAGALGLLLVIALLAGLMIPASAQQATHQFWGEVTINGEPAPEGTVISARINDVEYGSGTVSATGGYGDVPNFFVSAPQSLIGQPVSFYVATPPVLADTYIDDVMVAEVLFEFLGATEMDLDAEIEEFVLAVTSSDGGDATEPGEGTFTYFEGTVVDILAVPDPGFRFVDWTGDVTTVDDANAANTTITMNGNYTIQANFVELVEYDLTVTSGSGGNVTEPGEGIFTYYEGIVVDLLAVPDLGWNFQNWTGDVATIGDVNAADTTITMNGDYTIQANFTEVGTKQLTVSSSSGGNAVEPGEGVFTYTTGTVVDLLAVPAACFGFVDWTGDVATVANATAADTTITMNDDYTIQANFAALPEYNLTVSSSDGGNATEPGEGIFVYCEGIIVDLLAVADLGFHFVNWTGEVSTVADANAADTTITMDDHYTIQANFDVGATPTPTPTATPTPTPTPTPTATPTPTPTPTATPTPTPTATPTPTPTATPTPSPSPTASPSPTPSPTPTQAPPPPPPGGGFILPSPSPTMTPTPTGTPTTAPTATPVPTATATPVPTTTPPPAPSDLDFSGVIDDDGVIQDDVDYSSPDGVLEIHVDTGTKVLDENDEPLQGIEVDEVCDNIPPPPAGAYIVGCAYDFRPDGAKFDPPITITLNYDPALIPEGVAEEELVIAYYNVSTGQWVILPSTVDTANDLIMAEVSHLTLFAVYAPAVSPTITPTPTPDEDEGTNIWIIVGPIIAVVLLGVLAFFILRGRPPKGPPGARLD